jgi:hypothetical protein
MPAAKNIDHGTINQMMYRTENTTVPHLVADAFTGLFI